MKQAVWLFGTQVFTQDIFVIPDGAPGALAELERRKFTAEEGVRISEELYLIPLDTHDSRISQDHFTLLNGILPAPLMNRHETHFC